MDTPLEIHTAFPYRSNLGTLSWMSALFALFVALGTNNLIFGLACLSPISVGAAVWLIGERSRPERIVIDPLQKKVVAYYRSWSGKAPRTWALERWKAVQSYVTTEGMNNMVVLRTSDKDFEVLSLSEFPISLETKSCLSVPVVAEAPEATELRIKVAATGLFEDRGFSPAEIAGRYVA